MNRPTVVALLGSILIAVSTPGFAQNGRRAPAIASSDVLSQISMFSYREGKKSTLNPSRVGTGGPGYTFADEPISGDYYRGTLAMANAGPNTNGSQFFICHQDLAGRLPKNYTIFGSVTKGMDVVDQIANAPRNARDLPDAPVAMKTVTVLEDA